MIEQIKLDLKNKLEAFYKDKYSLDIQMVVETPKKVEMGDISIPMFMAVKALRKPMPEIVAEAIEAIKGFNLPIKSISNAGAFINMFIDKTELSKEIIIEALTKDEKYGESNIGLGKNIVLDYSSPNIAKSFSVGHLRSTMIGNSLKLILQKCGYNTTAINYLGDWGTQFGKMIVAIEKWGNIDEIKKDPINELSRLYVKVNDEEKNDPSIGDLARAAFRKIEMGEEKYVSMWKWIREESLKESEQIYDLLDVNFDSYNGEAFYNDKMDPVVDELEKKGILELDQGAMVVKLDDDLPPALIKRSDGGTLYITRDLAAVFYRKKEYNFEKALYVVGGEQKLHFLQLKGVLAKMGYQELSDSIYHVNFGLVLKDGKKMSTRKGNVVKLYDILMQAIQSAKAQIEEKNPNMANKDEIATKVGCGAVVFNDLKNFRALDYEFDINQMVKFEGQTGPYLQYTGVRIASILKDKTFDYNNVDVTLFEKPHYFELVKLISQFRMTVEKAAAEFAPSVVAKYLLSLAASFNKFYSLEKINVEDEKTRNTNFAVAKSVRIVLNEGLRLLGIHYLDEM